MLDISVVLPCYDDARLAGIEAALTSVRKQSLQPRAVVVAVDNNPGLARRLGEQFDWVTVVLNDGARGASATRNAGVAAVGTEFAAFLDDDEEADPDWLAELTRPFDDPAVVGTGGKYEPDWLTGKPFWFPDDFAWAVGGAYQGLPTVTSRVRNVWSGNMAVRTSVFRDVGGFRAEFGKQDSVSEPEDTDLCIRMASAGGGQWMYVPSAVILHQVPASRSTLSFFLGRCFAEGRGKAAMRRRIGEPAAIDVERDYVWTATRAALRNLATCNPHRASRGIAAVAGLGCASVGFVVETVRPRRSARETSKESADDDR